MNRALLAAFAPIAVSVALLACNGKVVTTDDSGSTSSKQRAGEEKTEKATSTPSSSTAGTTKPAPPEPACSYEYQSSSSSGDPPLVYSCESKDNYTCNGAPQDITCSCSGSQGKWSVGSCSCNGKTFEFDCNDGCSPGAAEYAKCNLPLPDDYGSTGSGTSSTSSSSGSTSSSSGG